MTGVAQKLKEAGDATHMVGKWDAGMAPPEHTPKGRGCVLDCVWFRQTVHAAHTIEARQPLIVLRLGQHIAPSPAPVPTA